MNPHPRVAKSLSRDEDHGQLCYMPQLSDSSRAFRVCFLGPPAVGKSTLCKAVLQHCRNRGRRRRDGQQEWISIHIAGRLAEQTAYRHYIQAMPMTSRVKMLLRLLSHGLRNYMWHGYRKPFQSSELEDLQKKLLVTFLEQHHALFVAVAEHWFDPDMALPPLAVRYDELLSWTKKWLFSNIWAGSVRILADNCRFTRGVAELLSSEEYGSAASNAAAAKNFLFSPIGPSGVVHIEADAGVIVERVKCRERKMNGWRHPGHRKLSDEELVTYSEMRNDVNAKAVRVFRGQGMPVLTLCGSAPLAENVRAVWGFLGEVVVRETRVVSRLESREPVGAR